MHEHKIAVILRDDLKNWQKLNVTAFLAGAVAPFQRVVARNEAITTQDNQRNENLLGICSRRQINKRQLNTR
jgi:hypothetical protein